MNKYLILFLKIVFFVFLLCFCWFGVGAWLRNQPSSFLYFSGTVLNILVPVVIAKGLQLSIKDFRRD